MFEYHYLAFNSEKENELLQFVEKHPWKPHWSNEHIKEFIQLLISSGDLIFDLYSNNNRIAIAVLIDKIQNKGNNACLEVLALDQSYDATKIYHYFIESTIQKLPETRSGIEITIHESLIEVINLLKQKNFVAYYDIFEMQAEMAPIYSNVKEIVTLLPEGFAECYEVTKICFKDNPEMAIPNYKEWEMAKKALDSQSWVYMSNNNIVGFVNSVADVQHKRFEIRSIGVLPNYRGKGIGRKLLQHSLSFFTKKGISSCNLTVASQNRSALRLYEEIGFHVNDTFNVYCWNRRASTGKHGSRS